jgi:outer membrane protein assembly factor BamB
MKPSISLQGCFAALQRIITRVAGLGALACLLVAMTSAQPSLKLSATSGPPTTNLTVSGTGFADSSLIDIYFDTIDMVLAASSATGGFSGIALQIPSAAQPGTHWVTAVVRSSGSAAQKSFLVQTNWTEFGFTSKDKRNNPYENTLSPSTVGSLDLHWTFTTGLAAADSPAAVANGVVYVGAGDDNLYALNANTGALMWLFTTDGPISSTPAVANGVIYVASQDHSVYALSASKRTKLWSFPTGGPIYSSPVVANGVVYVGSNDQHVYALNANTGAELWSFASGGPVLSSPAVTNGVVYVGSEDKNVYALSAAGGGVLWSFTTDAPVESGPAVANGVVYIGSYHHNFYALDASTGIPLWSFAATSSIGGFTSPAVVNGVVYVGGVFDLKVYALDTSTGVQLWNFPTGSLVESSPAVANGVVYVGSDDYNVYALDASTGARLWTFTTGGDVSSSPAVVNGVVYVGSNDYSMYAFDQAGGLAKPNGSVQRPDPTMLVPDYKLKPSQPSTGGSSVPTD